MFLTKLPSRKTRSTFHEIHPSKSFYPSHPQTEKTVQRYLWLGYFPGKQPEKWRIWGSFIPITMYFFATHSLNPYFSRQPMAEILWNLTCRLKKYLSGCTHFFTQFLSILSFFRVKIPPLNAHEWRPCTMLVPETVKIRNPRNPICKHPKTTWSSWKYNALLLFCGTYIYIYMMYIYIL